LLRKFAEGKANGNVAVPIDRESPPCSRNTLKRLLMIRRRPSSAIDLTIPLP
jgi:hypothetical protein